MHKLILLCLIFVLTACQIETKHDQKNMSDGTVKHSHELLEVASFGDHVPLPAVTFSIQADPMEGWNIHIKTENFQFTPENSGHSAIPNEGHAHLFVDGYKIARVYGSWFHLKKLTPGAHNVRISLNANDHSTWGHEGQEISATQDVEQLQ